MSFIDHITALDFIVAVGPLAVIVGIRTHLTRKHV